MRSSAQKNRVGPDPSLHQDDPREKGGCMPNSVPIIGHHRIQGSVSERAPDLKVLMEYWRSLLDPQLRALPQPFLENQLEEVQVALRDALYHLARQLPRTDGRTW
jgi:hypothetical protein